MVRVRAPTSSTRPSAVCRITTRLASHARRRDVSAETCVPSWRTDCPGHGRRPGTARPERRIDPVVKGCLGEQAQRVRLLLGQRGRFLVNVCWAGARLGRPRLLIQRLAGRGECLHEQRSGLRRQPAADDHHAVLVVIHVQRAARMAPRGFPGLGQPVHPSPPANDPLDVGRGAGPPDRQQPLLGLGRGHAGQGADLGVRQLSVRQCLRSRGRVPSARATRTRSRAAPGSSPTRHVSQPAQDRKPVFQPPRASNSRIRSSRRAVAASRCAASSAISSPRRSSSAAEPTMGSEVGSMPTRDRCSSATPPCSSPTLHADFRAPVVPSERAITARSQFFGRCPAPHASARMRAAGRASARDRRPVACLARNVCQCPILDTSADTRGAR